MSNVLQSINSEDFVYDKAVEINGQVYDLPQRSAEINAKLIELEKKRTKMDEYDFFAENFEVIFGKENSKKILKDGKKTNLDYLAMIYKVSCDLIYEERMAQEQAEIEKRLESTMPLLDKIGKAGLVLDKVK